MSKTLLSSAHRQMIYSLRWILFGLRTTGDYNNDFFYLFIYFYFYFFFFFGFFFPVLVLTYM